MRLEGIVRIEETLERVQSLGHPGSLVFKMPRVFGTCGFGPSGSDLACRVQGGSGFRVYKFRV